MESYNSLADMLVYSKESLEVGVLATLRNYI